MDCRQYGKSLKINQAWGLCVANMVMHLEAVPLQMHHLQIAERFQANRPDHIWSCFYNCPSESGLARSCSRATAVNVAGMLMIAPQTQGCLQNVKVWLRTQYSAGAIASYFAYASA